MGALLSIARKAAAVSDAPSRGDHQAGHLTILLESRLDTPASGKTEVLPDPPESALDSEYFEERAAIREFDGGFSREEAERLALIDLQNQTIH